MGKARNGAQEVDPWPVGRDTEHRGRVATGWPVMSAHDSECEVANGQLRNRRALSSTWGNESSSFRAAASVLSSWLGVRLLNRARKCRLTSCFQL